MSDKSVKGSENDALTSYSDTVSDNDLNSKPLTVPDMEIKSDAEVQETLDSRSLNVDSVKDADDSKYVPPENPSTIDPPVERSISSASVTDDKHELKPKKSRMKKNEVDVEGHEVIFTVTISMAVPTIEEEETPLDDANQSDAGDILKAKKRTLEAPKAQNFYHLEYTIFPDADDLVKTDVVTFGMGAKIYLERQDPLVKKVWREGEITWIAWSQKHKLFITKDVLLKLYNHTLELRIWDTKDKVGTRAKFDRPKLSKLPTSKQDDSDEMGGVMNMVMVQSQNFIDMQPKKAQKMRPLPNEITYQKQDPASLKKRVHTPVGDKLPALAATAEVLPGDQGKISPTPHALLALPKKNGELDGRSSFSRLGHLANQDGIPTSGKDSRGSKVSSKKSQSSKTHTEQTSTPTSKTRVGAKSAASTGSSKAIQISHLGSTQTQISHLGSTQTQRKPRRNDHAAQTAAENIKKYGISMVAVRMSVLFAGLERVTNRLESPVLGLEDMFVTIQLDTPLLDEKQRLELNPMIIKIHSATNMPNTPLSYQQLSDRCLPPYCSYTFFKLPPHVSMKRCHLPNIYWDDINVVLTGTFEQSELREYLNGSPLEIEVHDRDRRPEEIQLKATLFGDDLEDEKISNVGTVASRRTLHNPFKDKSKVWDPYGVAHVDLSDLLLGQRYLHIKVPVHSCPLPDLLGYDDSKTGGKVMGMAGAVDGPVDSPLPGGHYLSSHTMLKVKVELAHPLVPPESVTKRETVETSKECPFSKIVYKFDYKNTAMLHQLQTLVTNINARALELDDMPQHVIDAALSTYKLSGVQQQSHTLDIITGFHVLDGAMHIFVLEGLRDCGIKELWQRLLPPEMSDVSVVYHSNLTFSQRLYGPLDVDLCRVKLHEPLCQIVQQPLLYVRDMVPKPCFEALVKLHELTRIKNMRDAVRNELFPTAEMVVSMSKEFGVPFTTDDFEELHLKDEEKSFVAEATTSTQDNSSIRETSKHLQPIDNMNLSYMEKLLDRAKQQQKKDFIQEHINKLKVTSDINRKEKEMRKPMTVKVDVDVAHNYSTQTLNTTELAKEKLRQILAKDPKIRYSYNQDYHHSMTFVPVNVETIKKQEKLDSKSRWQDTHGWVYPGMRSHDGDNKHPYQPHVARSEDLKERWHENALHVGVFQAPLDRDRYPWELRHKDLDLYKRPLVNFGLPEPQTVHLAGDKLLQEKLTVELQEKEQWKSKVVVKDPRQYFHRCLTETEFRTGGRKASNQLARLQGLLKDQPNKLSLSKPGMALANVPPLNVVLYPGVDTDARLAGITPRPTTINEVDENNNAFKPGAYIERSWVFERNQVPVIDYEHEKFEKLKGHDFNAYHKERSKMWRRTILPLTDEERDNHLFRFSDDPKRFRVLPELSLGDRSMTQPLISTINMMSSRTDTWPSQSMVSRSLNDPQVKVTTDTSGMLSKQQTFVTQPVS